MALTYKVFLKKGIDLAPLGIEKSEYWDDYFCTPKGASMIGSSGVDGIHFCFIRGFGEMVFAVNPFNVIGEYVHPIARTFEDLLSLLVSTGDAAAVEQAWMWDKEMFYKFLQENPPTKEQEQTMWKLQHDFSIPFMEEPFDYIRELQAEFDYSKIKFTAEYYDVVGDESEVPKEWKVYFDNGYWKSSTNRTRPGTELVLNGKFVWGNEIWHIPSMYLCSKGFVIDYCVEIEPEKVKAFIDKWEPTRLNEEHISSETRQQIESDNPLEMDFYFHYMLNGKIIRQMTGTGLSYIPDWCLPDDTENPKETLAIIEHYNLDPAKAWSFYRHSCPWAAARKPKEIKSFSIKLERCPTTIQGIHFKNPSVGDVISFKHPVSGIEHKLTVLEYEQQELSTKFFANEEYEYPTYHTAMTYTIEPPLSGTAFTVRDCLENETARHMPKKRYEPDACIGIIGGADGPTAVIVSPKNRGGELHVVLSALHFEPVSDVEWKMEFREKMMEDVEVELVFINNREMLLRRLLE